MTESPTSKSRGPLLEPAEKSFSDFIVPGIIGVAGAALLYSSFSKKKKATSGGKSKAPAIEARDQEIKFSKNFAEYSVGKNWEAAVLEPFLSEQVEEGNLLTLEDMQDSFISAVGGETAALAQSRKNVLSLFRAMHHASTDKGDVLFSQLPSKGSVPKFNEWLDSRVKVFQEEY